MAVQGPLLLPIESTTGGVVASPQVCLTVFEAERTIFSGAPAIGTTVRRRIT